jgi:hypothetical protein
LKRIVVRFRAPASVAADQVYVDAFADLIQETIALFADELQIQVDYPEGSPQFVIPAADESGTISGEPDTQDELITRLRATYRKSHPGVKAKDFAVYFLRVGNYDGFTRPARPDIVMDVDSIGCTWVLAHEIGHVLGNRKKSGGHEDNEGHVMYAFACDILNPPPEFPAGAQADYQGSKYCQ